MQLLRGRPMTGPAVPRRAAPPSEFLSNLHTVPRTPRSRAHVLQFQKDERSIDRPQGDAQLGSMLVPAYENTPADLVAELQLRKFLGLSAHRDLKTAEINSGIKGADACISVRGTIIQVDGFNHTVLAVVVKENCDTQKLPDLTLHWATCQHDGGAWVPPPAGVHQYPSDLIANMPGCGAWRTPFAVHTSPDGKPLHVALLQIPMDGVLSSGGVTFVLNSRHHWMHNPHHGRDWYVQLAGNLPVTTDLEGLPDPETFPASLDQAPSAQELADRQLLDGSASRTAELQQRQHTVTRLAEAAANDAAAAAARVVKAQAAVELAVEQLAAAEAAVQVWSGSVEADEKRASAARAVSNECFHEMAVVSTAAGASLDVDGDGCAAFAEAQSADAKGSAAKAVRKAAESALLSSRTELTKARAALAAAAQTHEAAAAELSTAKRMDEEAGEECRAKAAEAAAVCEAAVRELAELAEACGAATTRVWAHVQQRQTLAVKRFLVEAGPNEPLNLNWLLPPSLSGRSLPVVPTAFNGVRNIQSVGEEGGGSWKQLEPCSVQDLQLVMRSKLRKWMKVTPSQELNVIQYRCSTRLPGGSEVPVLVWMTESQGLVAGKTGVVLVIAVDQAATGSRSGRLQLHWGAAMREGMAPTQLAGDGWTTSSSHNWESSGCTLVTPFTAQRVPKLGIGQLPGQKPAFAGVGVVSGDYCALTDAADASAGDAPTVHGTEKQAHVVLLQLPLHGLLMHGGMSFTLKDSSGFHLNNAGSGKSFFLELGMMMQQLAHITRPLVYPPEEQEQASAEV